MLLFSILIIAISVGFGSYVATDYYTGLPDQINPTFIGRQSCIECHQEQAKLFHGSHHDLAMDIATDETVRGKFDNAKIVHHGITSRMYRDGDRFMVHTEGPDGMMADFEVKYVFGYEPLQQYMVELDRPKNAKEHEIGRVQVLRISWDTEKERWFYLDPPDVSEKLDPSDPLHWTGITQSWNASCAECHSTNLQKNFDHQSLSYHTTYSEIDVSCEACHGPGSTHVELAKSWSFFWDRKHGMALPKLKGDDTRPQIETCAQCHSRRRKLCNGFRPGDSFHDYFAHELLGSQTYHADGQIKDEVYVYGSFLQSKMYHQNIRCSDCHDPHSTQLKFQGNQLCTSCHQHPAGKYDSPSHHFHIAGGPGSKCVDCHMPHTYYMEVDPRRDHSIRVPRPDMSVEHGTPNACTQCHVDSTKLAGQTDAKLTHYQDWLLARSKDDQVVRDELQRIDQAMAEAVKQWYPASKYRDGSNGDFVSELLAARNATDNKVEKLCAIVLNRSLPEIVRASAMLDLRGDNHPTSLKAANTALRSEQISLIVAGLQRLENEISLRSDLVQYMTPLPGRNQQHFMSSIISMFARLESDVRPFLEHHSKTVRLEAARVYANLPEQFIAGGRPSTFRKPVNELIESLELDNDRGSSHRAIGSIYELLGEPDRAKAAYENATRVAPNLTGVRANLAALLENDQAILEQQLVSLAQNNLTQQIEFTQTEIDNIKSRVQRLRGQEHELLKRDLERASKLPNADGLHFRFAMSSYLRDELDVAEKHMLRAYQINPRTAQYLIGLATFYEKKENWSQAKFFATRLVELDPQHPGYKNLLEKIKRAEQ